MANQGFNADEVMRVFATMKLPTLEDFQALAEAQRRNMEAMVTANRVALEGAQAVAKRNLELLQQTMAEMTEAMKGLASLDGTPASKAAQHAELLKTGYERAMANMKELSDLIQKANGEALEVLNRRFSEAMEEMRRMMQKG